MELKTPTQKHSLLEAFRRNKAGLTDFEAAAVGNLPVTACYWKRAGELREEGLIEQKWDKKGPVFRKNPSGVNSSVSVITKDGLAMIREWNKRK